MYRSPPMITGASEHRSSTSAPRFALSLASRPNRFDNHLGLSAQPNTRIDRTHAALQVLQGHLVKYANNGVKVVYVAPGYVAEAVEDLHQFILQCIESRFG